MSIATGRLRSTPLEICTWDGNEEEVRTFAGEQFLRFDGDNAVFQTIDGRHEIPLERGGVIIRMEGVPLMYFWLDGAWDQILYEVD